jgi:uncharacterized protein YoaH (UPF0181 family)
MKGSNTYVRAQPNIEDLICAGMSSGPAIRTDILQSHKKGE